MTLRPPVALASWTIGAFFAAIGLGAVLLTLSAVLSSPRSGYSWAGLLVAVPLGGLCFTWGAGLLSDWLHLLHPSELAGDHLGLHLALWRTWSGSWANFVRVRAFIPREQARGVAFSRSQAGGYQLLIVHASGWGLTTGWEGPRDAYAAHARAIERWLRATPFFELDPRPT